MKTKVNLLNGKILAAFAAAAILPGSVRASMDGMNPHGFSTNAGFTVTVLVSDLTNVAPRTDPLLLNPWGIVVGREAIWINNNHSGLTTTYNAVGKPLNFMIGITNQAGDTGAATGLVPNNTSAFVLPGSPHNAPATFLMGSEDGTILAWNRGVGTNAIIVADRSGSDLGAVYKGLAIARDAAGAPHIFAANFHAGFVDVFDGSFNYEGSFTDTNLPANYAPFNIKVIRGRLFVTFAKQLLPDAMDDESGPGHGYIDIFDTDGTLLRSFAAQGSLNSPWGMAVAPGNFGKFSHSLLVGNFGDGRINAYDLLSGKWLGNLTDNNGVDIVINGLWGLAFDRDEIPGRECEFEAEQLYFTAGLNGEDDGLFGFLRPISPFLSPAQ